MADRKRYRKRSNQFVIAVQLQLDTSGFIYTKWGAEQKCKSGDWLLDNNGDIYTVDNEVFMKTYRRIDPGKYIKITPIWAEVAAKEGSVRTKEGESFYQKGDYLVYNNEDGTDAYCISTTTFGSMYELDT